MSPGNLSEEGPAESTELDISSNIILVIFLLLGVPYLFHFKQFFISFWRWLNIHGKFLVLWTYISTLLTILSTVLLGIPLNLRTYWTLPRVETNLKILLKLTSLWRRRLEYFIPRLFCNCFVPQKKLTFHNFMCVMWT